MARRRAKNKTPKKRYWERQAARPRRPAWWRRFLSTLWRWLMRPFTAPPPPPRIVLDTNILVGGIMGPDSASAKIVDAFLAGALNVVASPETIHEARLVFRRHGGIRTIPGGRERAERVLRALAEDARVVRNSTLPYPVCEDPSDDKFFAAAVVGNARYIVSNDKHLRRVGSYKGVKVLGSHRFAEEFPQR
ncbi:MAG: putative toxin-antitoxin system toxin component, PIN family [Candidatus Lernaella stagnicola]|nr:putative toxin-antitoxin system toxin component, PIN family [Candidatus Lernaella stagnicola]